MILPCDHKSVCLVSRHHVWDGSLLQLWHCMAQMGATFIFGTHHWQIIVHKFEIRTRLEILRHTVPLGNFTSKVLFSTDSSLLKACQIFYIGELELYPCVYKCMVRDMVDCVKYMYGCKACIHVVNLSACMTSRSPRGLCYLHQFIYSSPTQSKHSTYI